MKKRSQQSSSQRRLGSRAHRKQAIFWLALGIIILIAFPAFFLLKPYNQQPSTTNQPEAGNLKPEAAPAPKIVTASPAPTSYDLTVPYAPQAPFSNWTVHEESCEEAATYMYRSYLEKLTYPGNRIPDAEADTAFRAMKSWQVTNYGKEPDLTMEALGKFANSYYGYTPTVKNDITAEDIKKAVSDGHPVIVPVMTHSLENSMYGPYSVYHALLIKGYDATGVITNDAGVGNGVNKHYTWAILWQAIDAQTAKMGQGRELLYLTK